MLSVLWPTRIKPESSIVIRIGRVIHWLATAMAVAMAIYSLVARTDYPITQMLFSTEIAGAPFVYLFGRGLRYILAGE